MIAAWEQLNRIPDSEKKAAVMADLTKVNRRRSLTRYSLGELELHATFLNLYGQGFSSQQLADVLGRFTDSEREILFLISTGKADDKLKTRCLSENQRCRRSVQSVLKRHGVEVDAD